jgi:hypothetical protein
MPPAKESGSPGSPVFRCTLGRVHLKSPSRAISWSGQQRVSLASSVRLFLATSQPVSASQTSSPTAQTQPSPRLQRPTRPQPRRTQLLPMQEGG